MSRHRTVLSALVPLALALAAAPAAASSVQVWDAAASSWSNSGVANLTGTTVVHYLGLSIPCATNLTVTVSAGAAAVTAAAYSGASICSGIVPQLLPWPATPAATAYAGPNPPFPGAPTLTPALWGLTVSGIRLFFVGPPMFYCPSASGSASISGVLDVADQAGAPPAAPTANRFVYRGMMGPCAVQTLNNNALVADPALRIVP